MAKFVLRLKTPNETPIQEIAGRVKLALGRLSDLVTIGAMSQAPCALEVEILSAFVDPVAVAQALAGRMGAGVVLESVE